MHERRKPRCPRRSNPQRPLSLVGWAQAHHPPRRGSNHFVGWPQAHHFADQSTGGPGSTLRVSRSIAASKSPGIAPIRCSPSNHGCDLAKKTCDRANRICVRANRICERANETCSRANEICEGAPAKCNAAPKSCATGPRRLRPSKENLRRSKSDLPGRTEKVQGRTEILRCFKSTVREADATVVGRIRKQKSRITAAQACERRPRGPGRLRFLRLRRP